MKNNEEAQRFLERWSAEHTSHFQAELQQLAGATFPASMSERKLLDTNAFLSAMQRNKFVIKMAKVLGNINDNRAKHGTLTVPARAR
jgi:hypothetical protein